MKILPAKGQEDSDSTGRVRRIGAQCQCQGGTAFPRDILLSLVAGLQRASSAKAFTWSQCQCAFLEESETVTDNLPCCVRLHREPIFVLRMNIQYNK